MVIGLLSLLTTGCSLGAVEVDRVSAELDWAVGTLVHVSWTQDDEALAWLEFDLGDGAWTASPALTRSGGLQEEVILGAPGDTEVRYRVVTDQGGRRFESAERTVHTDPLPEILPQTVVTDWVHEATSSADWVLGSLDANGGEAYSGPFWLFIADRAGRIVWYRDLEFATSMFPRVARDGTHIAFDERILFDLEGLSSMVHRMTLDGAYDEQVATPGLGWCWDETTDGALLYDRNMDIEAATLEEVSPDGTQRTVWDCTAWMASVAPSEEADHCNTNTVNWTPDRDAVLWSTYWGDYIVEVDRQDGAVLWHAGALPGGWELQPDGVELDLQHYPNFTPDGTLLVSTHVRDQEGEQRAREFALDSDSGTLTQVWSYGEGVDGWAEYSGEAVRLANGNTLMNYGTGGEVREVDPEGATVWSLQFGDGMTLGHTQLVEDLYGLNRGR